MPKKLIVGINSLGRHSGCLPSGVMLKIDHIGIGSGAEGSDRR
jgi:hypothetical protein